MIVTDAAGDRFGYFNHLLGVSKQPFSVLPSPGSLVRHLCVASSSDVIAVFQGARTFNTKARDSVIFKGRKGMDALRDLPPLPKSLSGLINFNSTQWREVERVHLMRTMIQQDLSRAAPVVPARSSSASRASASRQRSPQAESLHGSLGNSRVAGGSGKDAHNTWSGRSSRLDAQLAVLRKEMVRVASIAAFDLAPIPPPTVRHQRSSSEGSTPRRYDARHQPRNLMAVPERTLAIDSSSGSSGEYD
ncbi:hypothetical protein HPB51_012631 [Rhipicephalus microplus]|uniref:Uncharacterized protein n=1 Tax=Rhipicephalus microplus TaxID=6941 RepID=A0A9J6E1N0_RHIMP|nr:hypothetical protein HPB51_012631 [Rhipicephalus microplus]